MLWKHVDHVEGAEVRRSRRLVISVHVTVANYEYLVYWRLYQDGSIECHVRATGIMVVGHLPEGEPARPRHDGRPAHLRAVSPALPDRAAGHGRRRPGQHRPHGRDVARRATPTTTRTGWAGAALRAAARSEGFQDYNWETQRGWKVVNAARCNHVGTPVAYKLVPGAALPHMLPDDSPVLRTAEALRHTLWVTPVRARRALALRAVPEPVHGRRRACPAWTAADRSIEDTDVVLWYVFGIHHITRMEDWPIMPVDTVSFWLKPFGFFDRNPTLDVPPTAGALRPLGRGRGRA